MPFAELDGDIRDKSFPAQTGRLMLMLIRVSSSSLQRCKAKEEN